MSESKKKILRSKSQYQVKPKPLNRDPSLQSVLQGRNKIHPRRRQESIGGLEEIVQCGICLDKLTDSRMLPCQHTFCLNCLQSQMMAKTLMARPNPPTVEEIQEATSPKVTSIKCPVCQAKVKLENGFDSLENLPKNLYIDSLLKVVEGNISPQLPQKQPDYRCVKCQTLSAAEEQICQHCVQIFCKVCFNEHLSELEANLTILVKQVNETKSKLDYKLESFQNRCDQLIDGIRETTLEKIEAVKNGEKEVLGDLEEIKHEGKVSYENINKIIKELKSKLSLKFSGANGAKVTTFMNLHRETSSLLTEVNNYGEARIIFDPEAFRLDQDTEGIYNDVDDPDIGYMSRVNNPFESIESMSQYYKTRSFIPKLVWKRCPRPAHIGSPPWDKNLLYIPATDTHSVLILNRHKKKLEGRLACPQMIHPQGIAFSGKYKEIYVSDKWEHCIHVFSDGGEHKRAILSKGNGLGKVRSPDGLAVGPNEELIISDSGNDRVIVINPQTGEHISTIGMINNKTTLNMPSGVAVSGDRIILADTGNHRIKIFDLKTGQKVNEFGRLGRDRGQFRSAEVVAVDSLGFILVGDGGNARIQVFKPDGTLVRVFGGSDDDGFGWLSGILVTEELEIVTTDAKSRCLRIF